MLSSLYLVVRTSGDAQVGTDQAPLSPGGMQGETAAPIARGCRPIGPLWTHVHACCVCQCVFPIAS